MKKILKLFSIFNVSFIKLNSNHSETRLLYNLSVVCFKDSGLWDFCITKFFDIALRLYFIFTLIPLTEHGWAERAVSNIWSLLNNFYFFNKKMNTKSFILYLENILTCLILVFTFFLILFLF